jgi:hypothetical protein
LASTTWGDLEVVWCVAASCVSSCELTIMLTVLVVLWRGAFHESGRIGLGVAPVLDHHKRKTLSLSASPGSLSLVLEPFSLCGSC